MAAGKVQTARVGEMWEVPDPSEVTGPGGTFTVSGGRFCLQHPGTYTNDAGDTVTVAAEVAEEAPGGE